MVPSVFAVRRRVSICLVLFSCFSQVTGQHINTQNLADNSTFNRNIRDNNGVRNGTISEDFRRSTNTWLDDIRKSSIASTSNGSDISHPHPYILAVWRQMAAEDGEIEKLGPGQQSVVSMRAEHVTGPSEGVEISVVFDLTGVYMDHGNTPVTVAQFILYKKIAYWDQLNLTAGDHMEVHLSVCPSAGQERSQSSSCIHTYSRTLTEGLDNPVLFTITDATRSLLSHASLSMQLYIMAWLFSREHRNLAHPDQAFVCQSDQPDAPLLVLYHNMEPPVLDHVLNNSGLTRQEERQKRNVIQPNGPPQRNVDCRLHEWELDFSVLHWSWIREPKVYQPNYCAGNCPSPLADTHYNSTSHAYFKNVFNMQTNWQNPAIPRACCVPIQFLPLSMLYYEGTAIVVKRIPEMIATSCACM